MKDCNRFNLSEGTEVKDRKRAHFCIFRQLLLIGLIITTFSEFTTLSQDARAQFPRVMNNFYFEVNTGYINYPFTDFSVEPGYEFNGVKIPHMALRIIPIGYEFNKYLSAQISYMRPVLWVHFIYTLGPEEKDIERAVWMNISSITIKPKLPLNDKFSVFGEAGMAIVTRNGFEDYSGNPVVSNANYTSIILGGGLKYHVNSRWGLQLSTVWSPENTEEKQPVNTFFSGGFSYKIIPLSQAWINRSVETGYIYPKQWLQLGFSTNGLGYGVNNFLAEGLVPVFWGGEAEVAKGIYASYQRNVYHGAKVFSLDWGINAAFWQSHENKENFITLSVFPVFRFSWLRTKPVDMYFFYSVAGPTYISKYLIDQKETGGHFTFADYMGIGGFAGKDRKINFELKIGHYSNGDLLPFNEGVKIPLSISLGRTF